MAFRSTPTTPVLFSVPFISLAERQVAFPDMALMSSRMRRPMWVDEIRFQYVFTNANYINMGYSLRCSLKLGRIAITSTRGGGNHIPIWNFGPALQTARWSEVNADGTRIYGNFRWKLPKPLYIPAGQSLIPEFSRSADGFGGTCDVTIGVVGRDLGDAAQPMPEKLDVPFVAFYEPDTLVTSAISSELDIVNPFLVPLAVQRFIGRQFQHNPTAATGATQVSAEGAAYTTIVDALSNDIANIAIKDSYGQNVVRDIVPMGDVFDPLQRGWVFQRILQPKERFVMQLSSIYNAANFPSGIYARPMISMIGYREEVLK